MSGISINTSGIKEKVVPELENAEKELKKLISNINSLTIPDDFTYKYKLKEYSSKVEKINKNVGIIKRNIQKTIRNFENMEKANANILNSNFKALSISGSAYSTGARVADETIDPRLATDPFSEQYVDSNNISLEELKEDMHFFTDIQDALNNTGAKISEWFDSAASTCVEGVKAIVASVANVVVSVIEGLSKCIEYIGKAVMIVVTGAASIATLVADGIGYLIDGKYPGITSEMWKWTMSKVSEQYVDNEFKNFYQNNMIGKWLDENSIDILKSDGIGYSIGEGTGEVLGIIGLTLLTGVIGGLAVESGFGVGTAATTGGASTVLSAIIATIEGLGKYTSEDWNRAKNEYLAKLSEMLEKGQITQVEYEQMKDEWANLETAGQGIKYGILSGAWEGVQWLLGGWLGKRSKAISIFVDTFVNSTDPLARAGIDSAIHGKDFLNAFQEQGGAEAMISNALIGLAFSSGSEYIKGHYRRKEILTGERIKLIKENLEKYKEKVEDYRYSNYLLKDIMTKDYEKICIDMLSLVENNETREKMEKILYQGGFENYSVNANIDIIRNNPSIEAGKRIAVAYLLAINPETFEYFKKNNINLYHGTNARALKGILEDGISSIKRTEENGVKIITGEKWSVISGDTRDFISVTDDLNTATGYSRIGGIGDKKDKMNFGALLGMSSEDLKKLRSCSVSSDCPEMGIVNNIPIEYIKTIAVPKDKVKLVKKMVGDKPIEVLSYDTDIPYYISFFDSYQINYDFSKMSEKILKYQKK